MKKRFLLVMAAVAVAAASAFGAPASASAALCLGASGSIGCGPTTTVPRSVANDPSFKGWGYVRTCPAACRMEDAWAWNGSGWRYSAVADGTQVYIYPFASGWSWIWTSGNGWRAMHSSLLYEGAPPAPCRTLCPL
jgi:hypothetical protein